MIYQQHWHAFTCKTAHTVHASVSMCCWCLCPQDFNVLRYESGQHYHMHMDTFDSKSLRKMDPDFGQRMATMIM